MSETKLRDVIEGALMDFEPDVNWHNSELVSVIFRRLQHAESLELDDGTVFVRRGLMLSKLREAADKNPNASGSRVYCCSHRAGELPSKMAERCECICHR